MSTKKLYLGLAGLVIVVAVVVGVSVGHSSKSTMASQSSSQSAVATNKVTIQNYMFNPMAIKVKVGTTVTWTNDDSVNHTVTADTPSADAPSSMDIASHKSYSFTFKKAGTYTYHCFPHPYMHGTVEVTS
jgi:plastocyanin